MSGALPNLVVIGAMKCGTSSLHHYLRLHPEVQMSEPKELNFFVSQADFDPSPLLPQDPTADLLRHEANWERGLDWYAGRFDSRAAIRGESSIAYSFPWYRGTAERMARTIPAARIVFLVRRPLERIASHRHQFRRRDPRPERDALVAPGNPYVEATRYATIIRPYLERFAPERVLILRADQLLERRRETLRELFTFLGVDASFWSPGMEEVRNRSAGKGRAYGLAERLRNQRRWPRRLPPVVRARVERLLASRREGNGATTRRGFEPSLAAELLDRLDPEIRALEQITGWDLDAWRRAA